MLEIGIRGSGEAVVTEALTARSMRSGELPVYATPAMLALVEETAWKSVAPALEPGQGTVGTKLSFSHRAATAVGRRVRCETVRRMRAEVDVSAAADPVVLRRGTTVVYLALPDNARAEQVLRRIW